MAKLKDILLRPIPDQSPGRQVKSNFRHYPLKDNGIRNDEPLVEIGLYGIAGQSYYSRPNAATGQPIPEVYKTVLVRESIADKLALINFALQNSDVVAEMFGGKVELYVNEGYRDPNLQRQLYEEIFPSLIRKQNPELSEPEFIKRRERLIAEPPRKDSPSPHSTGAAIDIRFRYAQAELGYVPNCDVRLSSTAADTSEAVYPDYYEQLSKLNKEAREVQRNRRIYYWIMRGALIDDDSGFIVNPHEWWHWSYGDQLWACLTAAPEAFFTIAPK
jgi:D-alanyl-D-alanine dipeptidase